MLKSYNYYCMKKNTLNVLRIISSVLLGVVTATILVESFTPSKYSLVGKIGNAFRDFIHIFNHPQEIPVEDIKITSEPKDLYPWTQFNFDYEVYPKNASNTECKIETSKNIGYINSNKYEARKIDDPICEDAYIKVTSISNPEIFKIQKLKISNVIPDMFDIYNTTLDTRYINLETPHVSNSDDVYGPHSMDRKKNDKQCYYEVMPNTEVFYLTYDPLDSKTKHGAITKFLNIETDERYIVYEKRNKFRVVGKPGPECNYLTPIKFTYTYPEYLHKEPLKYTVYLDFDWKQDNFKTIKAKKPVDFKLYEVRHKHNFVNEDNLIVQRRYNIMAIDEEGNYTNAYYNLEQVNQTTCDVYGDSGLRGRRRGKYTFRFSSPTNEWEPIEKTYTFDYIYKNPLLIFSEDIDTNNIRLEAGTTLTVKTNYLDDEGEELGLEYYKNFKGYSDDEKIVEATNEGNKIIIKAKQDGETNIVIRPYNETKGHEIKLKITVYGYDPVIKNENRFNKLMAKGVGHLCGFGVEGLLLSLTLYLYTFSLKDMLFALPLGSSLAFLTEFFEYFTPGRGCKVTDVSIDSIGVILGFILVISIIGIVKFVSYLKNKKNK